MRPSRQLRLHQERLDRAREALATAKARRDDPWRVAELQLAYDRASERVLDLELTEAHAPAARGPAERWPVR